MDNQNRFAFLPKSERKEELPTSDNLVFDLKEGASVSFSFDKPLLRTEMGSEVIRALASDTGLEAVLKKGNLNIEVKFCFDKNVPQNNEFVESYALQMKKGEQVIATIRYLVFANDKWAKLSFKDVNEDQQGMSLSELLFSLMSQHLKSKGVIKIYGTAGIENIASIKTRERSRDLITGKKYPTDLSQIKTGSVEMTTWLLERRPLFSRLRNFWNGLNM